MTRKRLSICTPLLAVISIMSLGAGHGTPVPTVVLYPAIFLFRNESLLWIILLLQFPAYGLTIDSGMRYKKFKYFGLALVLILHISVMTAIMNEKNSGKIGNNPYSAQHVFAMAGRQVNRR